MNDIEKIKEMIFVIETLGSNTTSSKGILKATKVIKESLENIEKTFNEDSFIVKVKEH